MSESALSPVDFGGLPPELSDRAQAKVLVWPVPFEKTVSYGSGTAGGPDAIIEASRNMELYDEELGRETARIGIHTLPAAPCDLEPGPMMQSLEQQMSALLDSGKFVCVLGGEHSITPPLVRAHHKKYPRLSVLQIDAHADLRDTYDGTKFSHASAMRRVVETCPAVQVGIRSMSTAEALAAPGLPTRIFYAKDIVGRTGWIEKVVASLSEEVYLTFDVDGLCPSIIPTTGTPEPGGLLWYETLELLRTVARSRKIVGMDFVELSGSSDNHAPAFATAKLIYRTLGYIFEKQLPPLA